MDTKTIQFIAFLNEMAELSKRGFTSFSSLTEVPEEQAGILYDGTNPTALSGTQTKYPVICDCVVDEQHLDIVSTWNDIFGPYGMDIAVVEDADGDSIWLEANSFEDPNFSIVVENGNWYNSVY